MRQLSPSTFGGQKKREVRLMWTISVESEGRFLPADTHHIRWCWVDCDGFEDIDENY